MRQYSWMTKWKQNLWALTEVSGVFALTWTISGFYHWSWSFLRFFLTLRWGPPAVNSIDCTWFRKMPNCIYEVSARKKMAFSDGTKTELLIHNSEHRVWRKPDVPHHLTPSLLLRWSRVAASCCGGVSQQPRQGDKRIEKSWMEQSSWWKPEPAISDWASPWLQRHHRSVSGTTLWMSLSGPARALNPAEHR